MRDVCFLVFVGLMFNDLMIHVFFLKYKNVRGSVFPTTLLPSVFSVLKKQKAKGASASR